MTTPDAAALFAEGTSLTPDAGRDLVREAADLGYAPANAWLAADAVIRRHDTVEALAWLRRISPEDAPDGVVIYPQRFHPTFGERFDEDGVGDFSPRYLIVSPDPQAAGRVLDAAGTRLLRVTETGVELAPGDDDSEFYTPNYVSHVHYAADGASIWTDTKGEISQEAAARMLAIVVEEMSKAEIVGVLAVPTDELRRPAS